MFLVTKLSKRTKTISWFLLHVFVLQIIPFSAFANQVENSGHADLSRFSAKAIRTDMVSGMFASLAPFLNEVSKPETEQIVAKSERTELNQNAMKLQAVSASGGGFTPGSMNDMVDPFTGDFTYSIPVMDIEGYPLTLNYNSNVNMNTEASWVGLGWDLDVGSISREMRGIPDEFNGEQMLATTYKIKEDKTSDGFKAGGYFSVGMNLGTGGFLSPNIQVTGLWGKYKNSYVGLGKTFDIG
jgi:hypothetical protein